MELGGRPSTLRHQLKRKRVPFVRARQLGVFVRQSRTPAFSLSRFFPRPHFLFRFYYFIRNEVAFLLVKSRLVFVPLFASCATSTKARKSDFVFNKSPVFSVFISLSAHPKQFASQARKTETFLLLISMPLSRDLLYIFCEWKMSADLRTRGTYTSVFFGSVKKK